MKAPLKAVAVAVALAVSGPAAATFCSLGAINQQCIFPSDTSGGTAIYTNPPNTSNVGSGLIAPFLGTQVGGNGGIEVGVNTDQAAVNLLPLDDKRDNNNTFTETLSLNQLGSVVIGGTEYFDFFLDINEPDSDPARFLSIDRLAIFGQTGATPGAPVDLNSTNITSLDDVDVFPNLEIVYRLGIGNTLLLNYSLFSGSGNGYDMQLLLPVSLFSNLAADSRIVFAVQYGGADAPGALAQDGFEEWAALIGPRQQELPEPGTWLLLGAAMLALPLARRK